jgi:holliday junction DNA helicase RuvA
MIGYISGLIIDKNSKSIVVLANGIGYNVNVTSDFLAECRQDTKTQLYIHTTVREDDISLYGFTGKGELEFFEQLISVSGIGSKIAMDILATPVHITQSAIVNEDTGILTKIKGIGKKTAERMILELKNKVTPVFGNGAKEAAHNLNEDAVLALESLGYERFRIIKAMADLPKNIKQTEDIVKYFLKNT